MRTAATTLLTLVLCAPAAAKLPDSAKLTPGGLGPLKVGLTEEQVERRLGRKIKQNKHAGIGGRCGTALLRGGYLLFTDDRLARISLTSARFATKSGLRVGMAQKAIRARYGRRAKRSQHVYDPDGFYFRVKRGNRAFVFETDGAVITGVRGGRAPEVDYVEGCA